MIKNLIDALKILPGIGDKSATRFAYYLLKHRKEGLDLALALKSTIENIKYCALCRTFSEKEICSICSNNKRNTQQLCIVETPNDIASIENSGVYDGKYFVLWGYLSPIDNVGKDDLKLHQLESLIDNKIKEIILATSTTIVGEITNNYIKNMFKNLDIKITHLARGIPIGGELEYTDINTIASALTNRC